MLGAYESAAGTYVQEGTNVTFTPLMTKMPIPEGSTWTISLEWDGDDVWYEFQGNYPTRVRLTRVEN